MFRVAIPSLRRSASSVRSCRLRAYRCGRRAFEAGRLPHQRAVGEGTAKAIPLEYAEHRSRWVCERPELPAEQPEQQVLAADGDARDGVAARVAEDDESPRMLGDGGEESLVVRVAADDAIEHDDVGRLDLLGIDRDVAELPLGPSFEARFPQEAVRFLVVARRELEVDGAFGAALEQLDLDRPDAASDLEHRRADEPLLLKERDHLLRRLVEPALAVALGRPAGETRAEEPVAAAWVAAAGHGATVLHGAPRVSICLRKCQVTLTRWSATRTGSPPVESYSRARRNSPACATSSAGSSGRSRGSASSGSTSSTGPRARRRSPSSSTGAASSSSITSCSRRKTTRAARAARSGPTASTPT